MKEYGDDNSKGPSTTSVTAQWKAPRQLYNNKMHNSIS